MNYKTFSSKKDAVADIKDCIEGWRDDLHPTDFVDVCREVAKHTESEAVQQEKVNDRSGVPER